MIRDKRRLRREGQGERREREITPYSVPFPRSPHLHLLFHLSASPFPFPPSIHDERCCPSFHSLRQVVCLGCQTTQGRTGWMAEQSGTRDTKTRGTNNGCKGYHWTARRIQVRGKKEPRDGREYANDPPFLTFSTGTVVLVPPSPIARSIPATSSESSFSVLPIVSVWEVAQSRPAQSTRHPSTTSTLTRGSTKTSCPLESSRS